MTKQDSASSLSKVFSGGTETKDSSHRNSILSSSAVNFDRTDLGGTIKIGQLDETQLALIG
eukprot:CAMPEP_0176339934 /NCGR_PEP_ID=MMETSP0126-20121128/1157_1 /TAXON_ID=141414 ORGANISM="Strombidinopsis acuminatum, Strain SPMC142" /NCGR_SAMPLE_ID=MMETSP0126 /ASSEMBLY_ACC=CAM_ASM_000229 /LENGTH=60 /DNA_ID=CAMNT_0017683813 /DNA_START=968 /DNA_END=1150 /DNA_ORIENTATION=-